MINFSFSHILIILLKSFSVFIPTFIFKSEIDEVLNFSFSIISSNNCLYFLSESLKLIT